MKALFIGGTGTISMAISRLFASVGGELYLLNRGNRTGSFISKTDCGTKSDASCKAKPEVIPDNVHFITADINDEEKVSQLISGMKFDVVADFIAFVPSQLERDYRLFKDNTNQFIYISSASAYQKPLADYRITEGTPLCNPYWEYSRNKIAGEEYLMHMYRENGFPVTIVRPSHTYDERSVPLGVHGQKGSYQVIKRMIDGKPVIIHGDGTSLWTMTHSSDFAKAFVGLMGNIHAIGEAVQITSDETLTWNQIYQAIASALGVTLKPYYVSSSFLADSGVNDYLGSLIGDKANSVVFDNTKLKKLVPSFCATKRFDQGIAKTISHVLSHPECQIEDPEFDTWCDRVIDSLEKAKASLRVNFNNLKMPKQTFQNKKPSPKTVLNL